jgi:cell division transport system permease protein
MSLVAVSIIYLSLLLVGAFYLTSSVFGKVAAGIESKISIQVFLKDGALDADVAALQASIVKMPNVANLEYVSKDTALKRYKEMTKDTPDIVANLRGNPLPASIEVTPVDAQKVQSVVDLIVKDPDLAKVIENPADPLASDVNDGRRKGVYKLLSAVDTARAVMAGVLVLLLAVSLVLIGNTIRLAIYSRRREIGIMRLVGASNWFIRTPFLLEGVLQSLIGSVLALLTLVGALAIVGPWLTQFFKVEIGAGTMAEVAALLIISGIVVGVAGSGVAVRRYMKV